MRAPGEGFQEHIMLGDAAVAVMVLGGSARRESEGERYDERRVSYRPLGHRSGGRGGVSEQPNRPRTSWFYDKLAAAPRTIPPLSAADTMKTVADAVLKGRR